MRTMRKQFPVNWLTSGKRTSSIAARISIEHKDNGTSDRVDVFSVENQ